MLPVRDQPDGPGLPDPTSAPDVDSRLVVGRGQPDLAAERVVPGLRIPGADGYLSDLAKGRAGRPGRRGSGKGAPGRRQGLDRAHRGRGPEAPALALPPQPEQPGHAPQPRNPGNNKGASRGRRPTSRLPTLNTDIETESRS